MIKSILLALAPCAAHAYKTSMSLVGNPAESSDGEIAGYGLDMTFWTEKDSDNADSLVL